MLKRALAVGLAAIGLSDVAAQAVIVTGPQGRNLTRPADLAGGLAWDLQGDYGGFLGTPIAPNWFITAAHLGNADSKLTTIDGVEHPIDTAAGSVVPIAGTDLVLRRVTVSFGTSYAPIFTGTLNVGDAFVVFGRGTARGTEITGRGWNWGDYDGKRSYGTNTYDGMAQVTGINQLDGSAFTPSTAFLAADFDLGVGDNEATLSNADSGGGVFVFRNGRYQLIGINYGVELPRTAATGTAELQAAIYDARGYYEPTAVPGVNTLITGPSAVPLSFVSSYVPGSLAIINATIPEPALIGLAAIGAMALGRRRPSSQ